MMTKEDEKPQYKINWVRVYQNPDLDEQKVGCSTPERPTRRYIEAHEDKYKTEDDVSYQRKENEKEAKEMDNDLHFLRRRLHLILFVLLTYFCCVGVAKYLLYVLSLSLFPPHFILKKEHPLKGIARGLGVCNPEAKGETRDACGGSKRGKCTLGKVCECKEGWTGPHCLSSDGYDDTLWDQPDKITDVGFVPPRLLPHGLLLGMILMFVLFIVAVQIRTQYHRRTITRGFTSLGEADQKFIR